MVLQHARAHNKKYIVNNKKYIVTPIIYSNKFDMI